MRGASPDHQAGVGLEHVVVQRGVAPEVDAGHERLGGDAESLQAERRDDDARAAREQFGELFVQGGLGDDARFQARIAQREACAFADEEQGDAPALGLHMFGEVQGVAGDHGVDPGNENHERATRLGRCVGGRRNRVCVRGSSRGGGVGVGGERGPEQGNE